MSETVKLFPFLGLAPASTQKPKGGLDLLGDLGGDPFASPTSGAQTSNTTSESFLLYVHYLYGVIQKFVKYKLLV